MFVRLTQCVVRLAAGRWMRALCLPALFFCTLCQPVVAADQMFLNAVQRGENLIAEFEASLGAGPEAATAAALRLQRDPLAVAAINESGSNFLKARLNTVLDTVKGSTKDMTKAALAEHYGVDPSEVTFFEATNKTTEIKVGQDWDVTAKVRGIDVPIDVVKGKLEMAYYRAAHGVDAPDAATAAKFAHEQAVEIINYKGREAYGGSRTEGGRIINGPKDQALRDPHQISDAIEVKSNIPAERAHAIENNPYATEAELMDAQGFRFEQARQYTKQFDKQIKARVEAMGGEVPPQIVEGTNILKRVAAREISPAEGRALLKLMGETPESIISKGAGLVEAAQVLRPGGAPGVPDVLAENVKDQLILENLAKEAAKKRAAARAGAPRPAGSPNNAPATDSSIATTAEAGAETGAAAPPSPAARAGKIPKPKPKPGPGILTDATGAPKPWVAGATEAANITNMGLSVGVLLLDYQTCIDQGRDPKACQAELATAAGFFGSVTALGALVVPLPINYWLANEMISMATVTAASTAFAAAGLALTAYITYTKAEEWAVAPEVYANNILHQQQKAMLMEFERLLRPIRLGILELQQMRNQSFAQCQAIDLHVQNATNFEQASQDLAFRIGILLPDEQQMNDACQEAQDISTEISGLRRSSKSNEDTVIRNLDKAIAMTAQCRNKNDANQIFEIYDNAKDLAARMIADAANAHGRNLRLAKLMKNFSADNATQIQLADDLLDQLASLNSSLQDSVAAAVNARDQVKAAHSGYFSKRMALLDRVSFLQSKILPERAPSALYVEEFTRARDGLTELWQTLSALPDSNLCAYGEYDPASLITTKLNSSNRYSKLASSISRARQTTQSCDIAVAQDAAVDEMETAANWALSAVEMNDGVQQKADACAARSGAAGGRVNACPANSALSWNAAQQVSQCLCVSGYKANGGACVPDKKPEPLAMMCNSTSKAGSNPPETIRVSVGKRPGTAKFTYDMFVEPDQMIVQYGGQILADTGCVPGSKSLALKLDGSSDLVIISVKPSCRNPKAGTNWNFSFGCPSLNPPPDASAPGDRVVGATSLQLTGVRGDVSSYMHSPLQRTPVRQASDLQNGATVQVAANSQLNLTSPANTTASIQANTQVRIAGDDHGKQVIELHHGTIDVARKEGLPGMDDIIIRSEDGSIRVKGTRYRATRTDRGTEVEVFEGSVHLTGDYIIRLYSGRGDAGKPSPVQEMDLQAGEKAIMENVSFQPVANAVILSSSPGTRTEPVPTRVWSQPDPQAREIAPTSAPISTPTNTPVGTPGTGTRTEVASSTPARPTAQPPAPSPVTTLPRPPAPAVADPWNQPQVQRLIDEWMQRATPRLKTAAPGPWRFTEWGQVVGPGTTVAGVPDHPAGWGRYQSLWARRMQFESINLCTLGEFIDRSIAGKSLDDCKIAAPAQVPPSAPPQISAPPPNRPTPVAPPAPVVPPPPVAPVPAPVAPAPPAAPLSTVDFSGDWDCTITIDAEHSASISTSIVRSGNGYRIDTITSGVEGMVRASTFRTEGNRISMRHQFRQGIMDILVTKINQTMSGRYHEDWNDGDSVTYPISCVLRGSAQPPAPVPDRRNDRSNVIRDKK